jgi:cytochrome c-type biogenesis protein
VFVAFGTAFGGLGRLLLEHADVLNRVFGVVTILVGLGFLGWLPLLQRTKRLSARPTAGLAGAPLLGIVFGLGWTPCLGPTLSAVYSLAFTEATAARGAILGVAYCLGLGVPFVLVALGARWAMGATAFLRRHAGTVTRVGGGILVVVGLLLVTGAWTEIMQWLRSWLAATGFGESAL